MSGADQCATGSWDGRVQCVNPVADEPFCFECWLSIAAMGSDCHCSGCLADAGVVS